MASRYRSVSQPALSFIKSTITKPASKPTPSAFLLKTRSPVTARQDCFPYEVIPFLRPNWILCLFCASSFFFWFRWVGGELGCLQSLLPLHSAVSSARLTSCLGIDSSRSRSLSQGMLCSANPGV
ncbi:hypothetical protein LR48_Vigan561s000700 [Vigna angularis]|uniref:Uncharacterized protein n=1 Tax=Phaseolus angularis TaxID=3914 RepID=A0A0L9TDM8_PHAAN|nr:hypothetical protein LR48_Vigan561s000700 [Vigna angularis]